MHEEMTDIINLHGNKIQNHNKVPVHTYEMFKIKTRLTIPSVDKDVDN